MKRLRTILLMFMVTVALAAADYVPRDYIWTSQSKNSSESMPCGGHDIGMNVWVENGDVLFYVTQSGWFDENNTLLQSKYWMYESINEHLRLNFYNNPLVKAQLQAAEHTVLAGQKTSFVAAQDLLDLYFNELKK